MVFGLVGLVRQALIQRRQFVVLFLTFLVNVVFFVNYGALDKYMMFLPVYMVWSVWMALGFVYFAQLLQRYAPSEPLAALEAVGRALGKLRWEWLVLALPLAALLINFDYADMSSDRNIREQYTTMLESLEPNALYLGWWPDTAPMVYLQQVEDVRRDVWVVDRFLISRGERGGPGGPGQVPPARLCLWPYTAPHPTFQRRSFLARHRVLPLPVAMR